MNDNMTGKSETYYIAGRGCGKSAQVIEAIKKQLELREEEQNTGQPIITFDDYALQMAGIVFDDYQKQALDECCAKIKGASEAMVVLMRNQVSPVGDLLKDLAVVMEEPKMDYKQKHRPCKKDRFYY